MAKTKRRHKPEYETEFTPWVKNKNILFTGYRFDSYSARSTTDGVSLVSDQTAHIFHKHGAVPFMFGGIVHPPLFIPKEHTCQLKAGNIFRRGHLMVDLAKKIFNRGYMLPSEKHKINDLRSAIGNVLERFCLKNGIDLMVSENLHSFPMNMAFALACNDTSNNLGIPLLIHGHDWWIEPERATFHVRDGRHDLTDMIHEMVFGADKLSFAVINSLQRDWVQAKLSEDRRRGVPVVMLPNVMNFKHPPRDYADAEKRYFRRFFRIRDNDILILGPFRPVPRKDLWREVELGERIHEEDGRDVKILVTHRPGDEKRSREYLEHTIDHAKRIEGVKVIPAHGHIRVGNDSGMGDVYPPLDDRPKRMQFSLGLAYQAADVIGYPSSHEGFGNAIPEAVYYGAPVIVVNKYRTYLSEMKGLGLELIELEAERTKRAQSNREAAKKVVELLKDPKRREEIRRRNREIVREHLSFEVAGQRLLECIKPFLRWDAPHVITSKR